MKLKIAIILVAIITSLSFNKTQALTLESTQQASSPSWIEVGTVKGWANMGTRQIYGDSYNPRYNENQDLKLYVMYLGDKLIYRVERNGVFYSVAYHDPNTYLHGNASADIKDFIYITVKRADGTSFKEMLQTTVYFDVPTW